MRHSLKLHWFADLMNVTEEVTIHRPNVSTLSYNLFQRSIAQDATELKEKATNVEDALSDVNGFLQRLQDLAEEVSIKN